MTRGVCRYCGAEIVWAWTEATAEHPARQMPLDATRYTDDDELANVATRTDHTSRIWARVIRADRPLASFEHRAMPHFATCRNRPGRPPDELAARRRQRAAQEGPR